MVKNKLYNGIKIMENFKETVYENYRYIEGTENVCHDELLESLEFSTLTTLDCNIPNVSIKKYMSNGVIEVPILKKTQLMFMKWTKEKKKHFHGYFQLVGLDFHMNESKSCHYQCILKIDCIITGVISEKT